MSIGIIVLASGIIALTGKLGVRTGSVWDYPWPVILIILGLSFLWDQSPRHI